MTILVLLLSARPTSRARARPSSPVNVWLLRYSKNTSLRGLGPSCSEERRRHTRWLDWAKASPPSARPDALPSEG
eukprot:scaffold37223_cov326-Isochrysis_galbana.AAC.1